MFEGCIICMFGSFGGRVSTSAEAAMVATSATLDACETVGLETVVKALCSDHRAKYVEARKITPKDG